MLSKLVTHLRDEIVVLNIDGCASVIGFQEFSGKILKVAKVDSEDDEMEDTLVQKIVTEASKIPSNKDYNLNEFSYIKVKEQTSATLLRLISKLVSNITQFGWEIKDGIPVPAVAQGDPAPPELIDVIRCQCKVQRKKCSTMACGCHKEPHPIATVVEMRAVTIHLQ